LVMAVGFPCHPTHAPVFRFAVLLNQAKRTKRSRLDQNRLPRALEAGKLQTRSASARLRQEVSLVRLLRCGSEPPILLRPVVLEADCAGGRTSEFAGIIVDIQRSASPISASSPSSSRT